MTHTHTARCGRSMKNHGFPGSRPCAGDNGPKPLRFLSEAVGYSADSWCKPDKREYQSWDLSLPDRCPGFWGGRKTNCVIRQLNPQPGLSAFHCKRQAMQCQDALKWPSCQGSLVTPTFGRKSNGSPVALHCHVSSMPSSHSFNFWHRQS